MTHDGNTHPERLHRKNPGNTDKEEREACIKIIIKDQMRRFG